nr:unnamed protein product [Callosobruchus chinensis]
MVMAAVCGMELYCMKSIPGPMPYAARVLENKKTDSTTWRQKDEAWDKITNYFNSQTTEYARTKESLRKFYDILKKNLRKDVAEEKREIFKTGVARKRWRLIRHGISC